MLIAGRRRDEDSAIIDIGGGSSVLIDQLLDADFSDVTVLDISERALIGSKDRLGARAAECIGSSAMCSTWTPARTYDVWHDRAVFHFLTEERDRAAYRATLLERPAPGGTLILGTFAEDGPERCSGLPVQRWSADALAAELGPSSV